MENTLEAVHGELADEHRELMRLVDDIGDAPPAEVLPGMLERLHRLLIDHFAHEQFPGGLYERMGARAPENEDLLKQLVRDHCTILSDVRALVERTRNDADAGSRDDFMSEVRAVVATLHAHEHKEHELVERVKQQRAVS